MVRKIDTQYGAWLTGYYDDFTGARAIPVDTNEPNKTVAYDHTKTHYGNPMNGEAPLNPRFRWALPDRYRSVGSNFFSIAENAYLKNKGVYEWLSLDDARQNMNEYEGRAQLQYPDSLSNATKQKFNASGTGIHRFSNGFKTTDGYLVPISDNDSTYGRKTMGDPDGTAFENRTAGDFISASASAFSQRVNLIGCWMGETLLHGGNDTPKNIFAPLKSPSGQPFLCIHSVRDAYNTSDTKPTIAYDGSLNSQLDNDVFHARVAIRSFSDQNFAHPIDASTNKGHIHPTLQFKVGFPAPASTLEAETGHSGTPEIAYTLDLYNNSLIDYDFYGAKYLNNDTALTFTNDDAWIDVDFVINYTAGTYRVFINGNEDKSQTFNLAGNLDADEMYGWEMYLRPKTFTSGQRDDGVGSAFEPAYTSQYLMLDRVGLVHYLTDALHIDTNEVPLNHLRVEMTTNGISNVDLRIIDDSQYESNTQTYGNQSSSYYHHLKNVMMDSNDWELLLFASYNERRADRPVWRGPLTFMKIKQHKESRMLHLQFMDRLSLLDKQIPSWEVGQKSLGNDENETIAYWLTDADGYRNLMSFGTRKLKMLNHKLGFDVDDGYAELSDQRMQLGSGHPIQMYNNEDTYGPNNLEDDYDGKGTVGFWEIVLNDTGSPVTRTAVTFPTAHGFSASDTVSLQDSLSHNFTNKSPHSVTTKSLYFAQGDVPFVHDASSKILMITKYMGEIFPFSDYYASGDWYNTDLNYPKSNDVQDFTNAVFVFDNNPNLLPGDTFVVNKEGVYGDGAVHTVREIVSSRSYFNSNRSVYGGTDYTASTYNGGDYSNISQADSHEIFWVRTFTDYVSEIGGGTGETWTYDSVAAAYYYEDTLTITTVAGSRTCTITGGATAVSKVRHGDVIQNSGDSPAGTAFEDKTWIIAVGEDEDGTSSSAKFVTQAVATHSGTSKKYIIRGSRPLRGSDRLEWSKDSGKVTPITETKPQYKTLHSVWMRDLPHSLWFQYHFGKIRKVPVVSGRVGTSGNITKGDTTVTISKNVYDALNGYSHKSGIAEISNTAGTYQKIIFRGIKAVSGTYYLIGCDFVSKTMAKSGATINIVKIEDDYKHIWLNWADMRNNGKADADGGARKKDFGLEYPLAENYGVSLFYVGQKDIDGNIDKFSDLKFGEDVNLWNIDSTSDPSTGEPFSRPVDFNGAKDVTLQSASGGSAISFTLAGHGCTQGDYIYIFNTNKSAVNGMAQVTLVSSNDVYIDTAWVSGTSGAVGSAMFAPTTGSSKEATKYQDWHNKGGAFLIIDSAPFFNLNTGANHGRVGQDAGGSTQLEDYVATIQGYPALIDNYYAEAVASTANTGPEFGSHPHATKLKHESTKVVEMVKVGHCALIVEDVSNFDNEGVGRVQAKKDTGGSVQDDASEFYFCWKHKNSTERAGVVTGISAGAAIDTLNFVQNDTQATAFQTWGIKPGMTIRNDRTGAYYRVNSIPSEASVTIYNVATDKSTHTTDWATGDTMVIPVQLGNLFLTPASSIDMSNESEIVFEDVDGSLREAATRSMATVTISDVTTSHVSAANTTRPTSGSSNDYIAIGIPQPDPSRDSGIAYPSPVYLLRSSGTPGAVDTGSGFASPVAPHYIVDITVDVDNQTVTPSDTNTAAVLAKVINLTASNITATANGTKVEIVTNANVSPYLEADLFLYSGGFTWDDEITIEGWINGDTATGNRYLKRASEIEKEMQRLYSEAHSQTNLDSVCAKTEINPQSFNQVYALSSISPEYLLRLMMHTQGNVKSTNIGTYYDSDKFRVLWNAALMDTWLPSNNLATPIDINNVPITKKMTTDGGTSNNDSFGSIFDATGKSLLSIVKGTQKNSGYGNASNTHQTFAYLMGRDGRVDFRPKYNSGLTLDRSNVSISNMETAVSSNITNVRVYYNNSMAFVDYPSTSTNNETKWKILDFPNITNHLEALTVARQEYNTLKESKLKVETVVIQEANVDDIMTDSGRYGYLSDPYRAMQSSAPTEAPSGSHNRRVHHWTRLGTGGCLFPGMVNALDGNQGSTPSDIYARYGQSERYALDSGVVSWDDNFWWYGANSLSYAVQVVHIPNGVPFSSETSGEDLRMVVSLKNGQSGTNINNCQFTVWLLDYSFTDTRVKSAATLRGHASIDVKYNGFHEISIPTSYDSRNVKMVFSFNADYCRALLRHRCGDPAGANILKNANTIHASHSPLNGITTGNSKSIFPLGAKTFSNIAEDRGICDTRTLWYAPRIHISRDLSYWPGTYVKYTDAGLGLSNETLTIDQIEWGVGAGGSSNVRLKLERDTSFSTRQMQSFLFPDFGNPWAHQSITQGHTAPPPSVPVTTPGSTQTLDTDNWADQDPTDGGVSQGSADSSDNDNLSDNNKISISQIESGAWRHLTGVMDMMKDNMSGQGEFSILGQGKPSPVAAGMRGADAQIDLKPDSGHAVKTDDGYTFPSQGSPATEGAKKIETAFSCDVIVPSDVLSDEIEIYGELSHGKDSRSVSDAIIETKVTCKETGKSVSFSNTIKSNTNRSTNYILPRARLEGVNVPGNTLTVRVTRKMGSDTKDTSRNSVVLHNINCTLKRSANMVKSTGSEFIPYF